MAVIKITAPSGIAPKLDNRSLPDNMAQTADNCRFGAGGLTPLASALSIISNSMVADVSTIFRMTDGQTDCWLGWAEDVDCVRGQIAGDTAQRIYWTGQHEPRTSNYAMATAGGGVMPASCFVLGVASPHTAMTVAAEQLLTATITGATHLAGVVTIDTPSTAGMTAGMNITIANVAGMTELNGTGPVKEVLSPTQFTVALTATNAYTSGGAWTEYAPVQSRAYVDTFVTPWGEESAPSPVSVVTSGKETGAWSLSAMSPVPLNTDAITVISNSSGIITLTTPSTKYLRAGEELTLSNITGMTDANGAHPVLAVIDATHFTIALTTSQTYTGGGTWTRVAPHNTTGMKRRIYRALAGEFFFVAEIDATTVSYSDTVADADLGEVIPSTGWDMPPTTLKGLLDLPNGYNVGFDGHELYFSEPWRPHAFPSSYTLTCVFEIVGLAAIGSSIVVTTKGSPFIVSGSHPASLSMEKGRGKNPCVSKRSVISVGSGVLYACPDGLAFENGGGEDMATKAMFTRREFADLNPASIMCAFHNGMVYGWHDANAAGHSGFVFDLGSGSFSQISYEATARYVDPETNNLYAIVGGNLKQIDADRENNLTYTWKSKAFVLPRPLNFSHCKLDLSADGAAAQNAGVVADTAYNAALLASGATDGMLGDTMLDEYMLDGSLLRDIAQTLSVTVKFYADGVLKYTKTVTNANSFPLPSGFLAYVWEIEVIGNQPVYAIIIGESAEELRQT